MIKNLDLVFIGILITYHSIKGSIEFGFYHSNPWEVSFDY